MTYPEYVFAQVLCDFLLSMRFWTKIFIPLNVYVMLCNIQGGPEIREQYLKCKLKYLFIQFTYVIIHVHNNVMNNEWYFYF